MFVRCIFLLEIWLGLSFFAILPLSELEKEKIATSLKDNYVNFDSSFLSVEGKLKYYKLTKLYNLSITHKQYLDAIRKLYLRNNFKNISESQLQDLKIPKIIHQIWLGGPLPPLYKKWQDSWKKHHPDWKYILWNDESVKKLNLYNRKQFDKTINFAEKSDILRYELLYQFGGLYVDTDFECLKPFDRLHYIAKFYMGVCNRPGLTCNALIASAPGHPLLKDVVEKLKYSATKPSILDRTGPPYLRNKIMDYLKKTEDKEILLLPPVYFYPFPDAKLVGVRNSFITSNTLAIHYWNTSWVKK